MLGDTVGPPQTETARPGLTVDASPDGGEFSGLVTDTPVKPGEYEGAFAKVYALAGLNPADYRIVDETVRFRAWPVPYRDAEGEMTERWLYSYGARFRRMAGAAIGRDIIDQWRGSLLKAFKKSGRSARVNAPGGTYLTLVADPQLGKQRTEEAVTNWKRGVLGHLHEAERLIESGTPVEAIHVAFQGDETEGVANNYANQTHTIELSQTQQLELDYDLRVWTLKTLATLGLPMSASSVISNHGEWTRNGGKDPITTRGDNASTHVARQVKALFDELAPFGGPVIDWHIGNGDPAVLVNLSGVDCYFSHGYIEKGRGTSSETRTRGAIERQILGRTDALGKVPLWFMAHYHHHYSNEFEGRTLFGCPALEAERSSEYMLNQFGVWSPPGMLGMLIGGDTARRWSNASVR